MTVFTPLQFTAPGAPSGQCRARTQRTHMHLRGWANLKTDTAAPAAHTRSRSKTGIARSLPKADTMHKLRCGSRQAARTLQHYRARAPGGKRGGRHGGDKTTRALWPRRSATQQAVGADVQARRSAQVLAAPAAPDKARQCLKAREGTGRHTGGEASQNERKPTPE